MKNNQMIYQKVTDLICKKLESGVLPWRKPFVTPGVYPANLITKAPYRGFNTLLLQSAGYSSPFFLTYKQATDLGGTIRRGEKSLPVIFWRFLEVGNLPSGSGSAPSDSPAGDVNRIPLLRYYSVFNVEQTEGIPASKIPDLSEFSREHHPIKEAEELIDGYLDIPPVLFGASGAFYSPATDEIGMPSKDKFISDHEYYATFFHEMAHSTGHSSRLDRLTGGSFGSQSYAFEELVAEISASFLCGYCGFENAVLDNSAAYLKGWAERLRNNPSWFIQAAGKAQKAADYITGGQEAAHMSVEMSAEGAL